MLAPTDTDIRISWFRLFNEMKVNGWSLYRIEAHLHIAKSTLIGWKEGVEPRHADGEKLIELWQEVTSQTRGELPLERRYPNAYNRR